MNSTGSLVPAGSLSIFTKEEVEFESIKYFGGDELAATTVAKKYLLKNKQGQYLEKTPADMHDRLAREFTRIEMKLSPWTDEEKFYNRVRDLLDRFKKVVPQGSPMSAMGNPYQLQSLSNCFVVPSPKDSITGIFRTGNEMASIFKRRGGCGVSLSTLRPMGAPVNNAARISSGVPCFSDFISHITRMIGQGGRVGATMISLDIRHPDIENFVTMKHDLTKVTGANVSVQVCDDFMMAVEADAQFMLQWPCDVPIEEAEITREIKARDLWTLIVTSANKTAEPGILFWDTACRELPAHYYKGFECVSTNPCSEIFLSMYDSCRLISNNLMGWVKKAFTQFSEFDFDQFYQDIKFVQRLSDDLVELELEAVSKIRDITDDTDEIALWSKIYDAGKNGRRTGMGTHALADVLIALGIRYDSDEAIAFCDKLYGIQKVASYEASAELADERGAFKGWSWETDIKCPFIKRLPHWLQEKIRLFGRRNIANLTNAPTGTVALASQTASGIEPFFDWIFERFRKINVNEVGARVDRTDAMGDKWTKFKVISPVVLQYLTANDMVLPACFDNMSIAEANAELKKVLPDYFVTSAEIDYLKGVELQAAIQRHIDHSISKTINMPKGSTVEQVQEVYMLGWKLGLKGLTVYVDGSRDGVLVSSSTETVKKDERPTEIVHNISPKRPTTLPGDVYQVRVKGQLWGVVVGLLKGKPYEIFAGQNIELPSPNEVEHAEIKRNSKKRYSLAVKIKGNGIENISDLQEIYDEENQRQLTRSICRELRHGIPVEFIVKDLQENSGSLVEYSAAIARVLKKYITKPELLGTKLCPECGSKIVYVDGCVGCGGPEGIKGSGCGWSKCS
jgi:ribonucleoside-diphosphate reductase alpha chain